MPLTLEIDVQDYEHTDTNVTNQYENQTLEIEAQSCERADINVTDQYEHADINVTNQYENLTLELEAQGCEHADVIVTNQYENLTLEIIDAPIGGGSDVLISKVAGNRLEAKPDGLYVKDRLEPDPVAYYLLSRG